MGEVLGPFTVVHAHYIGADKECSHWLLQAGECPLLVPGEPVAFDVFTRRIGGEVRVSRHFSDGYREFWDAMDAALPELGVRHFREDEGPGWTGRKWVSNGRLGFQAHVKEVE